MIYQNNMLLLLWNAARKRQRKSLSNRIMAYCEAHGLLSRQNLRRAVLQVQWNYNALDANECIHLFRFAKADLVLLKQCLLLPDAIRLDNRCQLDGMLAFCITLRRLAYPARWVDLEYTFHLPVSTM